MAREVGGMELLQRVQTIAEQHNGDCASYLAEKYATQEQKLAFARVINDLYDTLMVTVDAHKESKRVQMVPPVKVANFTLKVTDLGFGVECSVRGLLVHCQVPSLLHMFLIVVRNCCCGNRDTAANMAATHAIEGHARKM
jgi:pyrroloquinoline quinone (PQQ) biosynthesis protein C